MLQVRRELMLLMRTEVLARLVHVLASCCPRLRLSLGLRNLSLGEVLGGLHVGLELLRGMWRRRLERRSVMMLGLMHRLALDLMHVVHWVFVINRVGSQVNFFVIIIALCIDLVVAVERGRGTKGHRGLYFDGTALPGLVDRGKLWWQTGHGAATRAALTGQWLLGSQAGDGRLVLAYGSAPLVDEAVIVPVAVVHTVLCKLTCRVGAQVDADGRHVGGARGPAARLQVVNLPACVLELDLCFTSPVMGTGIAAENLNLPVLLPRLVRVLGPVVEGIGNVAKETLGVVVEEGRCGQGR